MGWKVAVSGMVWCAQAYCAVEPATSAARACYVVARHHMLFSLYPFTCVKTQVNPISNTNSAANSIATPLSRNFKVHTKLGSKHGPHAVVFTAAATMVTMVWYPTSRT